MCEWALKDTLYEHTNWSEVVARDCIRLRISGKRGNAGRPPVCDRHTRVCPNYDAKCHYIGAVPTMRRASQFLLLILRTSNIELIFLYTGMGHTAVVGRVKFLVEQK